MANDYSISNNPIFQNSEYPFSELFALLPKLERLISDKETSYKADTNTLKAIHQHTENATDVLIGGIQSLGTLLATAAENKEMGLATIDVCNIGWLFRAIGNMLSGCHVLRANVEAELVRRGISILN